MLFLSEGNDVTKEKQFDVKSSAGAKLILLMVNSRSTEKEHILSLYNSHLCV